MPLSPPRDVRDAKACVGQKEAKPKVEEWLRKLENSAENDGALKLTLYSVVGGGGGFQLWTTDHVKGDTEVEKLVDEIIEHAEDEAIEKPGKTTFQVRCHGIMLVCRFSLLSPLRDTSDLDDNDEAHLEELELPNKRGMYAQMMRHVEVSHKELVSAARVGRKEILEENKELREENRLLKRQLMEGFRTLSEVHNMAQARDIAMEKFRKDENRKDEAMHMAKNTLGLFGPALVQRFTSGAAGAAPSAPAASSGGPAFGGFAPPQPPATPPAAGLPPQVVQDLNQLKQIESALVMFFESLSREQYMQLAGQLQPMQQAMLMRMHEILKERYDAQQAAQGQSTNANGTESNGGVHQGTFVPPAG